MRKVSNDLQNNRAIQTQTWGSEEDKLDKFLHKSLTGCKNIFQLKDDIYII